MRRYTALCSTLPPFGLRVHAHLISEDSLDLTARRSNRRILGAKRSLRAAAYTDYVAEQKGISGMTVRSKAYIAGIFEHPTRLAPDKTVAQLHAEVALGALGDAGLTRDDVDGYFCSGDAPGPGPAS